MCWPKYLNWWETWSFCCRANGLKWTTISDCWNDFIIYVSFVAVNLLYISVCLFFFFADFGQLWKISLSIYSVASQEPTTSNGHRSHNKWRKVTKKQAMAKLNFKKIDENSFKLFKFIEKLLHLVEDLQKKNISI